MTSISIIYKVKKEIDMMRFKHKHLCIIMKNKSFLHNKKMNLLSFKSLNFFRIFVFNFLNFFCTDKYSLTFFVLAINPLEQLKLRTKKKTRN